MQARTSPFTLVEHRVARRAEQRLLAALADPAPAAHPGVVRLMSALGLASAPAPARAAPAQSPTP